MNIGYLIFSLIAGWCGNEPRVPIGAPGFPKPPHPPDPGPWWRVIERVISLLGGLVGGFLVIQAFSSEVSLVTVSIGAFFGGRVFSSVYNIITTRNQVQ